MKSRTETNRDAKKLCLQSVQSLRKHV